MIEPIPPFIGFTMSTPIVPELYFEVETAEQRWLEICKWLQKLTEYAEKTGNISNLNKLAIEKLQAAFDEFKAHGFDDYYAEQVADWIDEHLSYIYDKTMKQVYFGLTSDGYFCAYVPDSWRDITFDTGAVYGDERYGRLILRYDVDGSGVIDNTK